MHGYYRTNDEELEDLCVSIWRDLPRRMIPADWRKYKKLPLNCLNYLRSNKREYRGGGTNPCLFGDDCQSIEVDRAE